MTLFFIQEEGIDLLWKLLWIKFIYQEQLKALARVRGFLDAIFLSDIVTADGRYIEQFAIQQGPYRTRSQFIFPKEYPNKKDWDFWITFWQSQSLNNFTLSSPMGV